MERARQNTPVTLSESWYEDGVLVDPGSVTYTVIRGDGTTLTSGTATGTGATGRSFNLTAADTALLDRLTVIWTSATKGQQASYLEICGGFLFSLAAALADSDLSAQTPATLAEARTRAEQQLERACGVAFVPRYERETVSGDSGHDLVLRWPLVRTVRAASVDGTALTSTELGQLAYTNIGAYWANSRWNQGVSNVVVGYEHGHDFPPQPVSDAALLLAKSYLVSSPANDPRVVMAQGGQEQFQFTRSGGGQFGIPEVDQVVRDYGYVVGVA